MAITYDKDGAYIEVTENGVAYRRLIKWEDCVVSIPGVGNEKIDLAYINSSDQLVLVLEDESEIIVAGDIVGDQFTQVGGVLVGTGVGTFQEESGATLRISIDTYSTAEVDAAIGALDYGLSFEGIVTTAIDSTHFKVLTLAGKGTGFFKPAAGTPYEIYVVEADGAAPEGEQTPVVAYTTADGTFEHAAFTDTLAVGDIVLIIHPLLATLGTKATAAADGAVTTTDYLMAYIKQIVTFTEAGGGYTHSDWKGNFNWDTSAYTTFETDISALFSTDLAIATRRKYSVKLDLTTVEADGDFVSCYISVKEKIDGTNYRAIDRKTILKADIAALAEPGIIIDIPATSENIQITMQMTTATAGDCTIYYSVVMEALE